MQQKGTHTTIAFVDDHALLRDALAAVINGFENCRVILLAANGKEFADRLHPGNLPDLVILDLNMPVWDGYATAKWLKDNHPEIPVLILTMYDTEIALMRLLQTGVRGFLKKDIHPSELRTAIISVMNTGYYYSYNATGRLGNILKNGELQSYSPNLIVLTENELAFLKFASTEMTYKEIALQMNISPRTIDNYRDSLFLKLQVKSRVALAVYAIKYGIVPINF